MGPQSLAQSRKLSNSARRTTKISSAEPGEAGWKRALRQRLLAWYQNNARPLPWRQTRDPYAIWVSEIMLQQTQVATVIPYFHRFLREFPTAIHLAAAEEQQVLRLWEGLGYYRRARQLHRAAQQIVELYQGRFPDQYDDVLSLPGIGRYTAGAVLSFAFEQPWPILETNTIRTYSRLAGYRGDPRSAQGQRYLWQLAEAWLPANRARDFNQAMMELGSAICVPRRPNCDVCPVVRLCSSHAQGIQLQIPLAAPRQATEAVEEAFLVLWHRGRVLVLRRDESSRWAGMWDFPRLSLSTANHENELVQRSLDLFGLNISPPAKLITFKHGVTRFRIKLHCFSARLEPNGKTSSQLDPQLLRQSGHTEGKWARAAHFDRLALSVTARKLADHILHSGQNREN